MKNHKLFCPDYVLFSLILLFILGGCSGGPAGSGTSGPPSPAASPEQTASGEPYEFDRGDFLARYQEALDRLSQGAPPRNPAPADPAGTGFAVVSLDQEVYGVSRFAFLPLSWRDLTDEELLSLAAGMDGLPAGDLLKPSHSRTGLQDSAGELPLLRQSRELSPGEESRLPFLEPGYLYEGNRQDRDPEEGPALFRLSPEEEKEFFAVLPAEDMSGDGLLRYLDAVYGNMPNSYWIPLEGELAYEELPGVLEEAADRFQLGAPPLPPYLALLVPMDGLTEEPRDPSRDYWMVTLLYPSGSQYAVSLRADTGELSAWVRWPQGFYMDGGASASPAASSGAARSEEELQASVAAYAAEVFPQSGGVLSIRGEDGEVPSPYFGPCRRFTLELEDGTSLLLTAAKQDGSLCAMTVLQTP